MIFLEKPCIFNPRFNASGCFVEADGNILLLQRPDHKPQGGTWGVPGGKSRVNETPAQAMCRELFEETGKWAPENDFVFIQTVFVRYPNCDFIYHMFRLRILHKFEVRLNADESKDFIWLKPAIALDMNLIPDEDACIKLVYEIK